MAQLLSCMGCGIEGCAPCLFVAEGRTATTGTCLLCAGAACSPAKRAEIERKRQELAIQQAGGAASLDFYHSSCGIGDAICALYAACGAADAGLEVRFHTHQAQWLTRFLHPGVRVVDDGIFPPTDIHRDYGQQLGQASCRKTWFATILAHDAGVPPFKPRPPAGVNRKIKARRVSFEGEYIVISPYASWGSRCWPATHWGRLAELFSQAGGRIVMIDSAANGGEPRLTRDFSYLPNAVHFQWGQDVAHVTDLLLGASAFIGNDSGMAHVAGALSVPTFAIHSQLPPEMLWGYTDIEAIVPATKCAFCRWQGARGWTKSCDLNCSALASISPEQVFETVQASLQTSLNPPLDRVALEHSLLGEKMTTLVEYAGQVKAHNIPGAVAEVGVYKGGSARQLCLSLPDRPAYLFDTFEGMPLQGEGDVHPIGDFGDTSLSAVEALLSDCPNAHLRAGLFPDTFAGLEAQTFAFVHLDGDQYQTTRDALERFYPRLSAGGVIVLDDYGWPNCPGVGRALEEFMADKPETPLHRLPYQAVIVKSQKQED